MSKVTGNSLNRLLGLEANHALYRDDGTWFHKLKRFPGVLFDRNGYVFFENERDFLTSKPLQIKQDVHIPQGISNMSNYVKLSDNGELLLFAQKESVERKKRFHFRRTEMPEGNGSPGKISVQVQRIIRDTAVTRYVKVANDFRCQICRESLLLPDGTYYVEAHHLKPLRLQGPDIPANVICVCPNHHAALDYTAISIDISQLTTVSGHQISEEFIRFHNVQFAAAQLKRRNHSPTPRSTS